MSQKLITTAMHWGWKVSFVLSVVWLMNWVLKALHDLGSERYQGLNADILQLGLIPLGLWLTVRWLALK
ncbi:MAG: hypothetical protein L7T24_09105 [Luminiphilus sp.]|nr:hypothetical protein [Luminiphilus sp.]